MTGFAKIATYRTLRDWLSAGPVARGVSDGLTFVARAAGTQLGKASWILRYRYGGRQKKKVIRALEFVRRATSPRHQRSYDEAALWFDETSWRCWRYPASPPSACACLTPSRYRRYASGRPWARAPSRINVM